MTPFEYLLQKPFAIPKTARLCFPTGDDPVLNLIRPYPCPTCGEFKTGAEFYILRGVTHKECKKCFLSKKKRSRRTSRSS